jgi:antitoxin ParD1/3/4
LPLLDQNSESTYQEYKDYYTPPALVPYGICAGHSGPRLRPSGNRAKGGAKNMDIKLNNQMQQWIKEKVGSGYYGSASEVINEGLRLLKNKEDQRNSMTEDLRKELLIGIRQLDSGQAIYFDSKLVDDVKMDARSKVKT